MDFPSNSTSEEVKTSKYARTFDENNPNWHSTPEYNRLFLRANQNYANDQLQSRGHIFLNEIYDMLGFARSSAGAVVGWIKDGAGDNYVDFGFGTSTDDSAIQLDFNVDGVIYDKIEIVTIGTSER